MISLAEVRTDEMIYDGIIGQSTAMRDVFDQISHGGADRLHGARSAERPAPAKNLSLAPSIA